MRTFSFKVKNIGKERYLTYTMSEDCELDEDTLDLCEDSPNKELVEIIYEEDDEYDYLTYDITGRTSLESFCKKTLSSEKVLFVLRNVAKNFIYLKERNIHLSYLIMNRKYIYVDKATLEVSFICLPIEGKASVSTEFKGFARQFLANAKYDVDDDLNYVGKLLTYINGDKFNLKGLIGLCEALMEEAGISFEEAGDIDAEGGIEVVDSTEPIEEEAEVDASVDSEKAAADSPSGIMDFLDSADEKLPELDDEDEDEEDIEAEAVSDISDEDELESILPAGMAVVADDPEDESESKESDSEVAKDKAADLDETADNESQTEEAEAEQVETKNEESEEESEGLVEEEQASIRKPLPKKKPVLETDEEILKNRIKALVDEVPTAKTNTSKEPNITSLDQLDSMLSGRPPVVKKNVVKVNRAAIIQSAAEEVAANGETVELKSEVNTENIEPAADNKSEKVKPEKAKPEKNKNKSKATKAEPDKVDADTENLKEETSNENTVSVSELVKKAVPKANPYLVRVNTDERIMITKATFKIGKASRGVDYTVSGNGAISRQHAVIIQKDDACYIKDNKSTNHTYVNDKMVEDGVDEILVHDAMIRLGDEEFLFKAR